VPTKMKGRWHGIWLSSSVDAITIGGGLSKRADKLRLNKAIRAHRVRLIKSNGDQAGIVDISEARDLAAAENLDLVEISPQADPPVCKIMNFGKYKFQQSKKKKDAKQKQKQIQVKEIKFKPRIDEHDYQTKVRHIRRFLNHGDKVRVFVQFRGREMAHRDIGAKILDRVIEEVQDIGTIERRPLMEGNTMAMYVIGNENAGKNKKS